MLAKSFLLNLTATVSVFILSMIITYKVIHLLSIRKSRFRPPKLPTYSQGIMYSGAPYWSNEAVMRRYRHSLMSHIIPRSLYVSSIITIFFAHMVAGIMAHSTFILCLIVFLFIFISFIMYPSYRLKEIEE